MRSYVVGLPWKACRPELYICLYDRSLAVVLKRNLNGMINSDGFTGIHLQSAFQLSFPTVFVFHNSNNFCGKCTYDGERRGTSQETPFPSVARWTESRRLRNWGSGGSEHDGLHWVSSRRTSSLMKFVFNLISPMIISRQSIRQSSYHLLKMACKWSRILLYAWPGSESNCPAQFK